MSKNQELLTSFTEYCKQHPSERFWQALRNWSGQNYVMVGRNIPIDTFHSENRSGE